MKRLTDIVVAAVGLLLLAPVLALVAIWIKLDSPGPVFFRQVRVGRHGVPFQIHKFRTMIVAEDVKGPLLTVGRDTRITSAGAHLRRFKIDELPQLIDVLVGDMSLVGPRPEVPRYVERYPADVRAEVLSIRPGITDAASIEFSDESALLASAADPESYYITEILPRKLAMYQAYVRQRSYLGDFRIVLQTLIRIVQH